MHTPSPYNARICKNTTIFGVLWMRTVASALFHNSNRLTESYLCAQNRVPTSHVARIAYGHRSLVKKRTDRDRLNRNPFDFKFLVFICGIVLNLSARLSVDSWWIGSSLLFLLHFPISLTTNSPMLLYFTRVSIVFVSATFAVSDPCSLIEGWSAIKYKRVRFDAHDGNTAAVAAAAACTRFVHLKIAFFSLLFGKVFRFISDYLRRCEHNGNEQPSAKWNETIACNARQPYTTQQTKRDGKMKSAKCGCEEEEWKWKDQKRHMACDRVSERSATKTIRVWLAGCGTSDYLLNWQLDSPFSSIKCAWCVLCCL